MRVLIFCLLLAFSDAHSFPTSRLDIPDYQVISEKPSRKENTRFELNPTALQELTGKLPKSLNFLGQSPDGKAIFLDDSVSLSWQEGRDHCRTLDLRLLSVTSQDQQNFLLSRLPRDGFLEYWTSAREHRWESGFWWDEENIQPQFMTYWTISTEDAFPYKLCAAFVRHDGNRDDGVMVSRQCTDQRPVLCEAYSH